MDRCPPARICARLRGLLERIQPKLRWKRLTALFRTATLFRAALTHRRAETAEAAIGQVPQNGALMFSRRTTCGFLAAVNCVAKHFRDDRASTKKVDLEPVRLLLGARLGVDAFDVGFGIRIWSFSHESSDAKLFTLGELWNRTTRLFLLVRAIPQFPVRANSIPATFVHKFHLAIVQSMDCAQRAAN